MGWVRPRHKGVSLTHTQSGWPGPRLSAMEIEVEAQRLRKACVLLRLRMQQELSSGQWGSGGGEEGRLQEGFQDWHALSLPSLTVE